LLQLPAHTVGNCNRFGRADLRRWQGALALIVTFGSVAGLVAPEQARHRIVAFVSR
jgi:hypothetical protein